MALKRVKSTVNKARRRLKRLAEQEVKRAKKLTSNKSTKLSPGQKRTSAAALGHPASKQAKKSSFRKGAVLGGAGVAGLAGAAAGIKALQSDDKDTASKGVAKFRKSKRVKRGKYKIKRGDTLSEIARDHNTTVAALMKANPSIKDKDMIYAGDTLTIPSVPFPTRPRPKSKNKQDLTTVKKSRRTATQHAGGGKISSSIPSNRRSRG